MPYIVLILQSVAWFITNLITLHFQVLSIYFYGLTTVLFGNRVTGIALECYSQVLYQKEKMEEVLLDEDEPNEEYEPQDDTEGPAEE